MLFIPEVDTAIIRQDTADGFSEEKINRIIQSLADETYMPKPVRREYIPKKRSSTIYSCKVCCTQDSTGRVLAYNGIVL